MKAISPSTPAPSATAPLRSDRSSETSAADEAFGALIAAAIGVTPRPVIAHEAPPKQAAPSVSSVKPSSSSRDDRTVDSTDSSDSKNNKADADQPAAPSTDQATATASGTKPTASRAAPVAADARKPVAVPVVAVAKPTAAPVVSDVLGATSPVAKAAPAAAKAAPVAPVVAAGPAVPAVPAGLETAAAALARALTADAPATQAKAATMPQAKPVASSASALAQGQLPAQLVKLPTASAPAGEPVKHPVDASAAMASPVVVPAALGAPQTAPLPVADTAAAQVAPNAASTSLTGQHDAHGGKGDAQHSSSTIATPAPATTDSKAVPAPTPFDQTLQAPNSVANVAVPVQVQQPVVTAVSQAAQAVMAPPAEQIVQVVAPLRTAKDGDYTLSLQLHPADLGPVTVRVDVHQGVLSVHMVADHAQGHDALNQSLNDLRSQLEAGGVRTGDIGLGTRSSLSQQGGGQQQAPSQQPADTPAGRDGSTDRRPANSRGERVTVSSNDAALDVRI
jgi:flagellar hook-length control protein FliK